MNKFFKLLLPAVCMTFFLTGCDSFSYHKTVTLEAGNPVEVSLFLKDNSPQEVTLNEEAYQINTRIPGEYTVTLHYQEKDYQALLKITDTTPPTGQGVSMTILYGQKVHPEDLVSDISDNTEVTVSYPDGKSTEYLEAGQQTQAVILTDAGRNQTTVNASINVLPVRYSIDIKPGGKLPSVSDFAANPMVSVSSTFNIGSIPTNTYGVHTVPVNYSYQGQAGSCESCVRIVENDPPVLTLFDPGVFAGEKLQPEKLVASCTDASEVTFRFKTQPDVSKEGKCTVTVIASDIFDNETEKTIEIRVLPDVIAPLIYVPLVIESEVNAGISYKKNIIVADNKDAAEDIDIKVDSSQVKIDTIGEYPVTITATDTSGNSSRATASVKIVAAQNSDLYRQIDAILAQIIPANATNYDKVYQVYLYCRNNISYSSRESDKTNEIVGAYDALKNRAGDCYNYYALAKVMLDRLEIPNVGVERYKPLITDHYWLLVNCGDGYLHLDTCPRGGSGVHRSFSGFMRTDAELDYFNANVSDYTYYQFDKNAAKYPARATDNSMIDRNKYTR